VIIHDLLCNVCGYEAVSVPIIGGNFPTHCGAQMRWIPMGFSTDVKGSEQTSQALCEPDDPSKPVRFTSTRELERKMKQNGFVPAGDRHHGALGNSDPSRGTIYSSGKPGERRESKHV
jgi:hypothetical protein